MGLLGAIVSMGLSACGMGGGPSEEEAIAVRVALEGVPGVQVDFVNRDSPQSSALARGFGISVVHTDGDCTADDLRRVLQAIQSVLPDTYPHRIQLYVDVLGDDGETEFAPLEELIRELGLPDYLRGGPSRMTFTMADIAVLRA